MLPLIKVSNMSTNASPLRRCVSRIVVAACAALALGVGCSDATSAPSANPTANPLASVAAGNLFSVAGNTGPEWVWILRIAGGLYADHVQLVQFLRSDAEPQVLHIGVLPSRDWAGKNTSDLAGTSDIVR